MSGCFSFPSRGRPPGRRQAGLLTCGLLAVLLLSGHAASSAPNSYVGSESCRQCHALEYERFITYAKKSRSFESIQRLQNELTEEEIRRCYTCHTTGYGKPGGFLSPEETPHLRNAGCEVCHGPGALHLQHRDAQSIKAKLTTGDCEACHTTERVQAFRFKPLIHGGAH